MRREALAVAVAVAGVVGCSDVNIEKKARDSINVDDRLSISGRVCTERPDRNGFPVKVVFVVDQSGSMCVSDPPGSQESNGFCEMAAATLNVTGLTQPARVRALRRLLAGFATQRNINVAVVPFETNIKGVYPPSGFARPDDPALIARVDALQSELGKGTDYQGALAAAYTRIAADIDATQRTAPNMLPRTRYVVVFLSDGVPYPRCAANDNLTQYADDLNPDLTWEDSLGAGTFCNEINAPIAPADRITTFVAGTDRNQNYQLFSYVDQLMELRDQYNIGDVRLHTVLLFNEEAVRACGPICQDLYGRYVRWPGPVPLTNGPAAAKSIAGWTLQQLAQRGNGVYQEFNNFAGIAQLNLGALDYSSLFSRNVMKSLFVQPLSSEPGPLDRVVDSDGDGLPDEIDNDFSFNTSRFDPDSDGDGFTDRFEVDRRPDGFRPDAKDGRGCDPMSPLTLGCRPSDRDGDGLSDFAEKYLSAWLADNTLVDGDADGIPNGLEVRYGLDPLTPQKDLDTDGDTIPDVEEIRFGSHPTRRDREFREKNGIQYSLRQEVLADDSVCYDFTASNLQLVTPPLRAGFSRQGFNLFKLWFGEAPEAGVATDYGTWKAACVWAQYDPPSVRVPAGPETQPLTNSDFYAPANMIEPAHYDARCVGINPSRGQTGPVP
ncbi:MAG: VWA domain-containing protein [Myxococcus sp.]|nr:VWA domain-containing protein [Myxococcus sp.]